VVAIFATNLGPLIDVVNRFGSFFYGSLLGVFVLAVAVKRATSRGAFWGLIAGMAAVALVARYTSMAFLWHNVVGCTAVVGIGLIVSLFDRASSGEDASQEPRT
jgi:Na+/proline symporter